MAQKVLGFDLGGHLLKIAQVKNGKLLQFVSEQMPDNMVQEGHVVSFQALAQFIKETIRKHHVSGKAAAVALGPDMYFLRRVRLPLMNAGQLSVNLPFEFRDYVTGELSDYVYDYAMLRVGEEGMDLMAAAMSKRVMEDYKDMMHRAGLKLVKLVPDVLGIQSVLIPNRSAINPDEHLDFAVLDLGHTATRMYFFADGAYEMTRTMDSGGPSMAQALALEKGLDPRIAQIYLETNQDNVLDLPIITEQYEEIATEIMRVMNFYSYNNPNNTIDRLYYFGGGIRPEHLIEAIRESTGLEMHRFEELIPGGSAFPELHLGPQAYGIVTE